MHISAGQSADPNATLSDHLLLSVLQLLKKEVSEHGRHLQQYFHLFLMYSNLGVAEVMLYEPCHAKTRLQGFQQGLPNRAVQPQKMGRDLKFKVYEVEPLYYLSGENKDADQLCDYCAFVFAYSKKQVFSLFVGKQTYSK